MATTPDSIYLWVAVIWNSQSYQLGAYEILLDERQLKKYRIMKLNVSTSMRVKPMRIQTLVLNLPFKL